MAPLRPIRPKISSSEDPKPYSRVERDPLGGSGGEEDDDSPLPSDISPEQQRIWQDVADKINTKFGGEKTWQDCARRWSHMKQSTLEKLKGRSNNNNKDQERTTTTTTTTTTAAAASSDDAGKLSKSGRILDNVDQAVLRAMNIKVVKVDIKNNTRPQNLDHSYSLENTHTATTQQQPQVPQPAAAAVEGIKVFLPESNCESEIKKETPDIEIKEEVIDEMEENPLEGTDSSNDCNVFTNTTLNPQHQRDLLLPPLLECLRNVTNLSKLMADALDSLTKLQKKFE